jgi:hypothetical protein
VRLKGPTPHGLPAFDVGVAYWVFLPRLAASTPLATANETALIKRNRRLVTVRVELSYLWGSLHAGVLDFAHACPTENGP